MASSREFQTYIKKMERFGRQLLPQIVSTAINTIGGQAHEATKANVRSRMVLRNKYTENSIKFWESKPKEKWTRINAVSGSISPYMALQDEGGERHPKQGKTAVVVGLAARGGNPNRVVRKQYRAGTLGENQFVGKPRGGSRPNGVYERKNKNHKLRMLRDLSNATVPVKETDWHRDGVRTKFTSQRVFDEFKELVDAEIAKLAK